MSGIAELLALSYVTGAPVERRIIPIANPAAGADFTVTVPGEACWMIHAITATLTASATVANRVPALTVKDGTSTAYVIPPLAAVTAAQAVVFSWVAGVVSPRTAAVGGTQLCPLPGTIAQPGYTLGPVTAAIDATDQWSAITVWVTQAFSGDREHVRTIEHRIIDHADAIAALIRGDQ